jgi:hypothetical protein
MEWFGLGGNMGISRVLETCLYVVELTTPSTWGL